MKMSQRIYQDWLKEKSLSQELKIELAEIKDDPHAIHEAFYREMTFGTSGLRGIMGVGTNRINEPIIGKVTRGLADYIYQVRDASTGQSSPSVAISYDSRKNSKLFAEKAAKVLLARGIKVYMFRQLMPSPVLSYGVRRLGCDFGVMITASHNPKIYNGYKVYDHTGAQIRGDVSEEILKCISRVDIFQDVCEAPLDDPLFSYIEKDVEREFVERCFDISIKTQSIKNLHIVYTPLNGTGYLPVKELLTLGGAEHIYVVEEQKEPNGEFPTCPIPNPELPQVYEKGLSLAKEVGGDIVIATDPDGDRVGVALNREDGVFYPTGNQVAILLMDYLCKSREITKGQIALRAITGSPMVDAIGKAMDVQVEKTMVGFKHAGERIEELGERFFFGFEEGDGYLAGTHVRDKDGVSTALIIAQMTAHYKERGMDLKDALDEIYEKFGYYEERIKSFALEGFAGAEKMKEIMEYIRGKKYRDFLGKNPRKVTDYLSGQTYYFGSGSSCDMAVGTRPTRMPKADIMEFVFTDESKVVIRPSGTEPKIKVYLFSHKADRAEATAINDENEREIKKIINE